MKVLHVVDPKATTEAEQILAQTLQGLVSSDPIHSIWLKADTGYEIQFNRMVEEGAQVVEVASVWELLRNFRAHVKGAFVFKNYTESLNVAASLCGPMQGVALEESLLGPAQAEGLAILDDVRNVTEAAAYYKYPGIFTRGILVSLTASKDHCLHLRDLGVARKAFIFGGDDPKSFNEVFTRQVTQDLGPGALVFGFGPEAEWVKAISSGNGTGVVADSCQNLSVLQNLPANIKRPVDRPLRAEQGKRYVAFVMSDGDNVQWQSRDFVSENWWGSSRRGTFPMTWEVSPLLAEVNPRMLEHFYTTATPNDSFVTGAGAPGYSFLHLLPDRNGRAQQAVDFLRRSDLDIVSTINHNAGGMGEAISLLDLPEVAAMIYKPYDPYSGLQGASFWHRGKLCLSYRFQLKESTDRTGLVYPFLPPADWQGPVLNGIAGMPTKPETDIDSYALISVHAWSFTGMRGPLEAVWSTIQQLPENTVVVTANQLMTMVKENLGSRLTAPVLTAAVSWESKRLDVFGVGPDRSLYHQAWEELGWTDWEKLGGILTQPVDAVSWGPHRLDVFGVGADASLYHQAWDGSRWTDWEKRGGALIGPPRAVTWGLDRLDVFGIGTDKALYHMAWDGSRWTDWEGHAGFVQSIDAVCWGKDRVDVFGVGTDDALYHLAWDGSLWTSWQNLGGTLVGSPKCVSWGPDRIDVFGIGTDDRLYHLAWDGAGWTEWEQRGDQRVRSVDAVCWGPDRIDVFCVGIDRSTHHMAWDGSQWTGWEDLGGALIGTPKSVSWGPDRIDVFGIGTDDSLYHMAWDGLQWRGWEDRGGRLMRFLA